MHEQNHQTYNCSVKGHHLYISERGTVMVVIVWLLDLQLHVHVQSVPITTKVVSSNPA
jgi:hypothetical protein